MAKKRGMPGYDFSAQESSVSATRQNPNDHERLGGDVAPATKPTMAELMANHHESIAEAIAKTKVRGDVSRDLDNSLDNGPNDAFLVRDQYGTLPAKEKKKP